MSAKHTPGPWNALRDEVRVRSFRICSKVNAGESLPIGKGYERGCANARLIAAAPELLEALIAMESEKSDYMRRNNLGDPEKEHTNKMALAAIAKATGDQQ